MDIIKEESRLRKKLTLVDSHWPYMYESFTRKLPVELPYKHGVQRGKIRCYHILWLCYWGSINLTRIKDCLLMALLSLWSLIFLSKSLCLHNKFQLSGATESLSLENLVWPVKESCGLHRLVCHKKSKEKYKVIFCWFFFFFKNEQIALCISLSSRRTSNPNILLQLLKWSVKKSSPYILKVKNQSRRI